LTSDVRVEGVPDDGHHAWLQFIDTCQVAVGKSQLEATKDPQALVPKLFDAAGRLETHAERLLGAVVVFQIAGRLGSLIGGGLGPAATGAAPGAGPGSRSDLIRALSLAANEGLQHGDDSRVAAVMRYVQERHLNSDCRLVAVAGQLRMSRTHLSRLVLRQTGFAFKHHLQFARMHSAAQMLMATEMSIKEIASATGYEHVPSFVRKFRRYFQITPGRYRRFGSKAAAAKA
jgi:AraC-like DNA-binding protein